MTRALSLAALLAVGLSLPAFAADEAAAPAPDAAAIAAHTAQMSHVANANQVRKLLFAQGYTNVSNLNRGEDGRWVGTGVKNGKTVGVAIALPGKSAAAPVTN
jgi:hypothetical protein